MLLATEKLDFILQMFIPKQDATSMSYSYKDIQTIILGDKMNFNANEVKRILYKLIKDGFLSLDEHRAKREATFKEIGFSYYQITFEGEVFLQQGGYTEKERIKNINLKNLETEIRIRKRNEKVTAISAILAAVGAAGYFLLELWKSICH